MSFRFRHCASQLLVVYEVTPLCQSVVYVSGDVSLSIRHIFVVFQVMSVCQTVVCCVSGDVSVSDICLLCFR